MRLVLVLLCLLACGCGVSEQKSAIDAALNNDGLRPKTFEATARSLEQHPAWIDEFYRVARRHPGLMHRFLENSARDLRDPALARDTAQLLAANPPSLERVLIETVDASHDKPESRAAIDRAIIARHKKMADILTDSPQAVQSTMEVSIDYLNQKDASKRALLRAMRSRSGELAGILIADEQTLRTLLDAMSKKAGSDRESLKKLFRSVF